MTECMELPKLGCGSPAWLALSHCTAADHVTPPLCVVGTYKLTSPDVIRVVLEAAVTTGYRLIGLHRATLPV